MNNLFHKLLILRSPGVGPVGYAKLIQRFGSVEAAAESLAVDSALVDSVRREMDLADQLGAVYLSDDMPEYPKSLFDMKNHPPVISVRGNIKTLARPTVGIVGTRHASGAGMRFTSDLAREFAAHGYVVVSGMAMGTDTAAHRGALAADGDANTIAVLAGGVDYIWPLENERLYHYICERGCIVSDMPVGSTPVKNNFAQRNRIVAGISEKLILGEADLKSGSMITARFMLDLSRPVFAIPGHPSDPRGAGANRLIQNGDAKLCAGASDFFGKDEKPVQESSPKYLENDLVDLLSNVPMSDSVLASLAKKSVDDVRRQLIVLELDGLARKTNAGYVKS